MHIPALALLFTSYTTLAASAPFWGVFEQSPLTDILTTSSTSIKTKLLKASIIPDVLPPTFTPTLRLHLLYPSTHDRVSLGNTIPPSNVTTSPLFTISSLSATPSPTPKNTTYTLVLTDPDATSRAEPTKAQMCHWIITGLTLNNSSASAAVTGFPHSVPAAKGNGGKQNLTEIMEYLPPSPPPKTGYHRYVFVLLALEEGKASRELQKPKGRPHWGYGGEGMGVQEWARENGLRAVGAEFFYSEDGEQ